jgi:oxazoline/thiazoline synthase
MFTRPRLKKSFAVEILEPRLLFLMSEHRQHVFEGESFVRLAPLLDGTHSLADIVGAVGGEIPLDAIYATLAQMQRRGCLVEAEGLPEWDHTAFWEHLNADVAAVQKRLQETPLTLLTIGEMSSASWEQALENAGLKLSPEGDSPLRVVAVDDYLRSELAEINQNSLETARPWLLAKPVGASIWVGPLFRPGQTGCWKCLERRLSFNRQVERFLCRRTGRSAPIVTSKPSIASSVHAGAQLAAIELAKSLALDGANGLEDKILTLDLGSLELRSHRLVRREQCPACGRDVSSEPVKPLVLTSQPKGSAGEEDGRPTPASETFLQYQHHVSPITGIVTALTSRDPDPFGPTHNFIAAHYFPVMTDDLRILRSNLIARSGGKGLTEIQAKTSALCEALERYSGIAWGDERMVIGSYDGLKPEAIHVRDLALFSEVQYRTRESFNAGATSDRHQVPPELANGAEIAWAPAWSLSRERVRYLPAAYCYYGHLDAGAGFFTRCDSNGCAAGNSLEEAILHGFLEVVERDSVALWWYSRAERPAVDAASFGLHEWDKLERYYDRELNREIHVLDITADLGIPCFAVVSRKRASAVEDVIVGFGAHLNPRAALLKALGEANQYLPAVRDTAPDGSTLYRLYDEETVRWWRHATYQNQSYLAPSSERTRVLGDYQDLAGDDLKDEVETCVRVSDARGLEVLVLDQTRPDVGLAVAKVVVPGMRHFWRRLAPGRLYDVPVELGWVDRRLSESEMNPISCFV